MTRLRTRGAGGLPLNIPTAKLTANGRGQESTLIVHLYPTQHFPVRLAYYQFGVACLFRKLSGRVEMNLSRFRREKGRPGWRPAQETAGGGVGRDGRVAAVFPVRSSG